MQIADNMAVSIHYTLTNDQGEQLDSSRGGEPLVYLHGHGNIIPGLENALSGKEINDTFVVTAQPAEAYGERNEQLIQIVPDTMFSETDQLEVGMQFHAETNQGMNVVTITDIQDDKVTIDGNHPLSGVALTFDVEVVEIRSATDEEIEHKHIHSAGCNH